MWWVVALAIILILVAAVGVVIGPFLSLKRLRERVEINGMALVKDGFVSAGLVPFGEHEVALVDAGNDLQAKAILAELSRRDLGPDDVKVILLTHGHSDHTGGIAKFQKAQVMALAAEVDVVEGRSSGGAPIMRFRSPRPTGIRLSRTLHDGEVLPLGPYLVRVFAVPGHTPGSAAYAIGENLFLGDSANQDKRGRLKPAHWVFSKSVEQNRKSLEELARRLAGDSSIKTLVFSHSAPLERGMPPLVEFASHSRQLIPPV
jgi:glyoxylase-like metal-dependent hydrolase (beta-lactamase superfamily II)